MMYTYKFKKFLCSCALGMKPAKPWDGLDEANGGYIIVKAVSYTHLDVYKRQSSHNRLEV